MTRGLGPFLSAAFGESELRAVIVTRLRDALQAGEPDRAVAMLQLDATAGGTLPRRELSSLAEVDEVAPWLVRAIAQRPDADALLDQLAERGETGRRFKTLVAARREHLAHPDRPLAHDDQDAATAFGAPLIELLKPPRATERPRPREERKIGRNDPCPCGSGKKYKKCHLPAGGWTTSEDQAQEDASGLPGMTTREAFFFREAGEALSELCRERLDSGGPRAGETLFWPLEEAPTDEMPVRARIAAAESPAALVRVLARAWEARAISPEDAAQLISEAVPLPAWGEAPPVELYEQLPESLAERLPVAGSWTAADVLALANDAPARRTALVEVLESCATGDFALAVATAVALAQAPRTRSQAFLLARFVRGTSDTLPHDLRSWMRGLEGLLAPIFGHPPLTSEADWGGHDARAAQLSQLRAQVRELEAANAELEAKFAAEHELRKRAERAWAEERPSDGGEGHLKNEMRKLRVQLQSEHDMRRRAERSLETFRHRERLRLLRESELPDDDVAALEAELVDEDDDGSGRAPRRVSYHPDFEAVAQRLTPSTIERVRQQIDDLAAGKWVREAKRMEGRDNLWTLRAGIHYRALIREHDDHLEVFDLIPREELDTTLARLRS